MKLVRLFFGGQTRRISRNRNSLVECRCLDHIDSLGLSLVNNRSRYLVIWLLHGLKKLQHPNADRAVPLVKIYGPKVKFDREKLVNFVTLDRGPVLAFNVFDWKGEKVEPILVQKLADRKSISLAMSFFITFGFLRSMKRRRQEFLRREDVKQNKGQGAKRKKWNILV